MKSHWLLGCIGILVVGCSSGANDGGEETGQTQDEIVGGHSDRGKDAAVVAIDIGGQALCSGSLIGKRWVLTARHCVSDTTEEVQCPAQSAQIQGNRAADTLTILVGDDINSARPVALGQRLILPDSDVLCDHDMALIELDRDVTGVTPIAIGSLSGVRSVRGVGFGKRGDNAAAGKKMTRSNVPITGASDSEFSVGVLSCNGDSGGPALDSKGRVVGIVSRGGPNCNGPDTQGIYTRVDAFRDLIERALATSGDASSSASGSAGSDSSGAQGIECGSGKRCPNGSHCNEATLRCESSQ